ncbi:MAG: AAA family ATPase [Deltaproteobacteria bacterium]|nr:AAA family ATPase [Deltaproteobacteria bacterium]
MYRAFYGFKENPFNLTPDPDFLFMSRAHEEAYTHLEYAIIEHKGFVVITGEIGAGKTTLVNYLLRKVDRDVEFALVNQTSVNSDELMRMICQEYHLKVDGLDKIERMNRFQEFLIKRFVEGKRVALIIDEAQNLAKDTLEEIRMLSNLELEKQHLLQIILLGQPELRRKLHQRGLEQLTQRITVHWHLNALSEKETSEYILHRLKVAGSANPNIFDEEAVRTIYEHSRGIPRLINILCDASLVHGYADELPVINRDVVELVVSMRELGFHRDDGETEQIAETVNETVVNRGASGALDHTLERLEKRIDLVEEHLLTWAAKANAGRSQFQKTDERIDSVIKILSDMNRKFGEYCTIVADREKQMRPGDGNIEKKDQEGKFLLRDHKILVALITVSLLAGLISFVYLLFPDNGIFDFSSKFLYKISGN